MSINGRQLRLGGRAGFGPLVRGRRECLSRPSSEWPDGCLPRRSYRRRQHRSAAATRHNAPLSAASSSQTATATGGGGLAQKLVQRSNEALRLAFGPARVTGPPRGLRAWARRSGRSICSPAATATTDHDVSWRKVAQCWAVAGWRGGGGGGGRVSLSGPDVARPERATPPAQAPTRA